MSGNGGIERIVGGLQLKFGRSEWGRTDVYSTVSISMAAEKYLDILSMSSSQNLELDPWVAYANNLPRHNNCLRMNVSEKEDWEVCGWNKKKQEEGMLLPLVIMP